MKTRITKILSVLLITLLSVFGANAQIYQQQFSSDSATFSNRVMANGFYVNSSAASNSQLTYLSSNNAAVTIGVSGGTLNLARPGTGTFLGVRNTAFTATSLMMRFDYNVPTASGTSSNSTVLYVGNGYTNTNTTPANNHSSANLGIQTSGTPGTYRFNSNGGSHNTQKTILWVVNNSGATLTYKAPNGTYETVGNDAYDIWVGTVRDQNEIAAVAGTQAISNFAIRTAGGNGTHSYDNFLVDPIPPTPTSNAVSNIGNTSFTAKWTTVTGVTGYRVDVATDTGFTSMVSGYSNLYVSGQATDSLSVTGLGGGVYYYRVRAASQYTVDEFASGNSSRQSVTLTCTTPTINTQPSTVTQTVCVNGSLTSLSVDATGATSYQWYSNASNSNSGGTLLSGATSSSFTPSTTSASALYYYCSVSAGVGCTVVTNPTGLITIIALPTPTFTVFPTSTVSINTNQTYTTQSGQSSYVWTIPGTINVNYTLVSGGDAGINSAVISWLTAGSKTVTVGYSSNGCASVSPASNTSIASAAVFYNKANSDIDNVLNWSTNTNGIGGTQPTNFTDDGQTFNLYNTGATMSGAWDVQGAGSKVELGDGASAVTFAATSAFTATIVDISNNATLQLQTTTIPTFGTLATGSTVDYGGTAITQVVTTTSYSNLTLSGTGTRTFAGTTNVSGTFTPGSGFSATAGTIALNSTSAAQSIPAFAYNSLTVSGVDGKSTSGTVSVFGALTMSNSFTIPVGSTVELDSNGSIASTSGKVLTVNGTFQNLYKTSVVAFNTGSGTMTVAAGATFRAVYVGSNTALTFTNVNFTSGIGAAGSTLYLTGSGNAPRLPSTTNGATTHNGNVVVDFPNMVGLANIVNATPYTVTGNFTVNSTGAGNITNASGGTGRALTVQGNFTMNSGRYDLAGVGSGSATSNNSLTVNGTLTLANASDTLYTTSASNSGGTGTLNILGNLVHTAGVLGKSLVVTTGGVLNGSPSTAAGTIAFIGTATQDISTIGFTSNVNVTLNNSNGVRLLTDLPVGSVLTLTSGKLRTNGNSVVMTGTTSSIAGPSFGAASSTYIATCDTFGTPSTTGGLTIQNIGTGGRTSAVTFPVGPNTTSYNPVTVTNVSSAVNYTVRVDSIAILGISSDSAVKRTWNIQPASGSPSTSLAMQWSGANEGINFTRTAASVAHYNSGTTSIDVISEGGGASGSNPYTLTSSSTAFTSSGDFGVINGVILPATEPTVQASTASITAGTTTMTVNWTKSADATNSIVVVKQASAVTGSPVDAISYNDGGSVFGSGTQIGSGNYVVYTGTGNSVTVTGLTSGVTYHVAVYAYNGSNTTENYLTTSPATTSGTTGTPTYYYVGGAGSSSNTFATANMWATTLNGTPLAGFTPTNNDVFVFDASNLGGGYADSVTIAPISSATVLGKILLLNNAKINITASGTRTMSIGSSGYSSNTTVLSIPAGSKLYISGSQNTISLAANSSANISGSFYLGNGSGNSTLVPNATGSFITVNNGAYVETNLSSNSTFPFGATGTNLVTFASGSTYKHTRANDVFGGTGNSVVSFAVGSLFWYANTSNSSAQTLSGRSFGNVRVEGGWSPVVGSAGFTMYDFEMPSATGYTLTILETGTNNHFKGNITVASAGTLRFNPSSAATCNFSGTSLQTITMAGTWSLSSSINQSFIVSNTAGLSLAGNINLSGLAGTSMTVNNGCNLNLASGTLNVAAGTLNLAGTLTRTSGLINGSNTGATINNTGVASFPSGLFTSNNIRTLTIDRSAGVSIGSDLTISTALNLTSGVVDMGSNTLIIASAATVNRTSGWVSGNLRKNAASGSNITRTFEVGDATNYTPASLTFTSITTGGDLVVKSASPASGYTNYVTAPISNTNYINRYWSISNATSFVFTDYAATFDYVAGDKVGTSTESTVIAARYNAGWTISTPSAGTNANTVSSITGLGTFILGDSCIVVTPSVSISTASTTVCSGNNVTFTATGVNAGSGPVYQWFKNGGNAGSGSSITFLAGTLANGDSISCVLTANNPCQTTATVNSNKIALTVLASPAIGTSTGFTMCTLGSTRAINNSNTNGGGVWTSSNTAVATVITIKGSSGNVTAVGNGTDTLTYTKTGTNGCVSTATAVVLVASAPTPNSITGTNIMCKGGTTTLSTTTSGGVWSSISTGYATVSPTTGSLSTVVSFNNAGVSSIRYTVTNGSGCSAFTSLNVTVKSIPNIPSIGYATGTQNPQIGAGGAFCTNRTFRVAGFPSGGVWSKTGVITLSGDTVRTGVTPGASTLTYTVTSLGCSNSKTLTSSVVGCASKGVAISTELLVNSADFTMYPNPAKTFIRLNVETLVGAGSIVVTDLYGKQVKVQTLSMGTNTIDVSKLSKGMYFISTITIEGKTTKKLIVE